MQWTISGVLHFWSWFVGKTGDFIIFFGLQKFEFIEICSHFGFTHNNKKHSKNKKSPPKHSVQMSNQWG